MKFSCSIIINQPIDKVAALFADPAKLKEYQKDFIRKELISGNPGQEGAVSKMYYKQGKGTMELTETILLNNLPDEFLGSYRHKHMDNTMKSTFTALSDHQTRFDTEIEYTAFRGFFAKMLAFLFPGMFKKQVQTWLSNFKTYAEQPS